MSFTGLIIMDGYGVNHFAPFNAVSPETAPNVLKLFADNPATVLDASGLAVGLPDGQMGNSEVGHLNIGAGRIIYQELTRITKSIQDGDFFTNPALVKAMENAKSNGKKLHVMGLVSDGGVHSHNTHLYALVKMAKQMGLDNVYIHCFMDGRDVPPESGKGYIEELQQQLDRMEFGRIATISGRFYAMDRDNIWDRVEKAYVALADGEGVIETDPVQAMQNSYDKGVTDEFVIPTVITEGGKPVATVDEGDSIIFFNFRPDRARQITRSFIYSDFDKFARKKGFLNPCYVSFTQYDVTFNDRLDVAFKPETYTNTLGEYLSKKGNAEVRARHLLLQRRRGSSQSRRGQNFNRFPQDSHLRHEARNERLRGCRTRLQGDQVGQVRRDDTQLRKRRHGGTYRRARSRAQGGQSG